MIKIEIKSTILAPKTICKFIDYFKEKYPEAEIVFKADVDYEVEEEIF